jgi:hypothetical protein
MHSLLKARDLCICLNKLKQGNQQLSNLIEGSHSSVRPCDYKLYGYFHILRTWGYLNFWRIKTPQIKSSEAVSAVFIRTWRSVAGSLRRSFSSLYRQSASPVFPRTSPLQWASHSRASFFSHYHEFPCLNSPISGASVNGCSPARYAHVKTWYAHENVSEGFNVYFLHTFCNTVQGWPIARIDRWNNSRQKMSCERIFLVKSFFCTS